MTKNILLGVCAFILPCLAVGIKEEGLTVHFWINLLLSLCFHIPGVLHALWIIFLKD